MTSMVYGLENKSSLRHFLRRYHNAVLFVAGFLFDVATIQRIDSWLDILLQIAYIAGLTVLLVYQQREKKGLFVPPPKLAKLWEYNTEVLHFLYGGLLSAYVVLYSKSSSGARPVVFFLMILALFFLNEMPQVRRMGHRLRLGLYAFCVSSFMIYFVPILAGRIGAWVFLLSVGLSAALVWRLTKTLAGQDPDPRRVRVEIFLPAAAVFAGIVLLYFFRLIPPVPLSVQYQGIYHGVEKTSQGYSLRYEKPSWRYFWRKESRPYKYREGDKVYYFVRVFTPTRFMHRVRIRWEIYDARRRRYQTSDLITLAVTGGRDEGFRGYAAKAYLQPGKWRVTAETEDGRAMAILRFEALADLSAGERTWRERRM